MRRLTENQSERSLEYMKKRLLSVLLIAAVMLLVVTPFAAESVGVLGDADGDGELTILDANAIRLHLTGERLLSEDAVRRGMVTGRNELTVLDATAIQRRLAKIIERFPVELAGGSEEPEPQTPTRSDERIGAYEQQVIHLINEIRRDNGLSTLAVDPDLCQVARIKSRDMHDLGYFDHTSPTYGTPFEMLLAFGIPYRAAGENIAYGYRTPQAVVNGWMRSAGHRENILSGKYTRIGVGYYDEGSYWTQLFTG